MIASEITLHEMIHDINRFLPIKVTFNDMVLYNDYDSEVEIEEGIYGEIYPPLAVIPERIKYFKKSIVKTINIRIVQHHHSIVEMYGKLIEEKF